ncbi:MAG: transcriptional regulator [Chloroflexi bacterium]|nr:transcriptional regulator [Chloroflexota bacterium]
MPTELDTRTMADFSRARAKALFGGVLAFIRGRPNDLLSFDAVKETLRIGGPIYRGVRPVPIAQIAGSVNRYRDFDRAFLPTQSHTADRWRKVNRAFYEDVNLPPVLLYKVGEAYFVVDGNHRVSVAKEQGVEYIDAEVRECAVKVPLAPDIQPEDLIILGERVEFLDRTGLDRLRRSAQIELTILGGYDRLLEHIAVHRYFMGLDFKRDIGEEEAVTHWYDMVYCPIVGVIREAGVLTDFPTKTEGDLYVWVIDHQHFLAQQGEELSPPAEAAQEFLTRLEDGRLYDA